MPFGAAFILPFVVFTAYAILRYRLFNIKVAGTALLVFGLSVVTFIDVTQTNDPVFILYRSSIMFFVLVFGIVLIRSVLKEVKLREQIQQMAAQIERSLEVEKRANLELENLDKTKNQFLLLIQHNLRTPLTSMMGYTDLLINGSFGKLNKKSVEVIQKLQLSTQGMIKMVNNFLDVTQFQLGKSGVEIKDHVPLAPIFDEILNDLKPEADAKGIYLTLDRPAADYVVPADREKLKAALTNIIHNSIKYTLKGGVHIKVGQGSGVKIDVADTGIGISPENLKTIFNRIFERGEQAKRAATTGSGIGLYLASQIIKYHHGNVWAESEGEGKGSTFHIELPLAQDAAAEPSASAGENPGKEGFINAL